MLLLISLQSYRLRVIKLRPLTYNGHLQRALLKNYSSSKIFFRISSWHTMVYHATITTIRITCSRTTMVLQSLEIKYRCLFRKIDAHCELPGATVVMICFRVLFLISFRSGRLHAWSTMCVTTIAVVLE